MYGLSSKESGHCGEVVVSRGWTVFLISIRLCITDLMLYYCLVLRWRCSQKGRGRERETGTSMSFVDLYSIKSCYLLIPLYHMTSGPYTPPLTPCKTFSLKWVKPFFGHSCIKTEVFFRCQKNQNYPKLWEKNIETKQFFI